MLLLYNNPMQKYPDVLYPFQTLLLLGASVFHKYILFFFLSASVSQYSQDRL